MKRVLRAAVVAGRVLAMVQAVDLVSYLVTIAPEDVTLDEIRAAIARRRANPAWEFALDDAEAERLALQLWTAWCTE